MDSPEDLANKIQSSAASLTSNNAAREARRVRKKTADLQLAQANPTLEVIQTVNENTQSPISIDSTKKRQKRNRKASSARSLILFSPTGNDERLEIFLDELVQVEDEDEFLDPFGISMSKPAAPGLTQSQTMLPRNEGDEIVVVKDRKRIRTMTVRELELENIPKSQRRRTQYPLDQSNEAQVMLLVKKIQIYSFAISYIAFGLISGMGLMVLFFLPVTSPSTDPSTSLPLYGSLAILRYTDSNFITFFQYYSEYSTIISNIYSILSIIILVHALETRHGAMKSLGKVTSDLEQAQISTELTLQGAISNQEKFYVKEANNLRKRIRSAFLLVLASGTTFISNAIMISIDEKWNDAINTKDNYFDFNDYQFKVGPYPLVPSSSTVTSTPDYSKVVLNWFWQYSGIAISMETSVNLPDELERDIQLWTILNLIRGLFSLASLIFALMEIRYRVTSKKKNQIS